MYKIGDVIVVESLAGIVVGRIHSIRVNHLSYKFYNLITLEGSPCNVLEGSILTSDEEIMRSVHERVRFLQKK